MCIYFSSETKAFKSILELFVSLGIILILVLFSLNTNAGLISKGRVLNGGSGSASAKAVFVPQQKIEGGYFLDAWAIAGPPPPDKDTIPQSLGDSTQKPIPSVGKSISRATRLVSDFAANSSGQTSSSAIARITFKNLPLPTLINFAHSAAGSWAQVDASSRGAPAGGATYTVEDPLIYPWYGEEGDILHLKFSLDQDFAIGATGAATAKYHFDAGTNISDYDFLFALDIDVLGTSRLNVSFRSNPNLNLLDSVIQDMIFNELTNGFNPTEDLYVLSSELLIFEQDIQGIQNGSDFSLSTTQTGRVSVPEPETITLLMSLLPALLLRRKIKKNKGGRYIFLFNRR